MNRLSQWLFDKPSVQQGETIAALDVGSSKIACFIARAEEDEQLRVVGIGHQLSEGVRGGLISDMDAVQNAIRAAVGTAEQMAGENIERVIVNVAAPLLCSQTVDVSLQLGGREITQTDLDRVVAQSQTLVAEDQQGNMLELIHTLPVHYALDGQKGIRDPLGMVGGAMSADIHLVSAAFGPVRTLITAIAHCHLEVEKLVAAPYASGLACLVEDEMDLGCTVIDMGAGTTSIGIFFDGHLIYTDGVPLGGMHITNDVARGLTTTLAHAERLKALYGNATLAPADDREIIDVPQVGEEDPAFANHLPKSHLIRIIQPRLEEIFELTRARLNKSGLDQMAGRRVVLTGGASQLPGVREMASRLLDKQARLGRPLRITRPVFGNVKKEVPSPSGLAEATSGPAFATTAGLLAAATQEDYGYESGGFDYPSGGFIGKIGQFFRMGN